jgi:hypothetical protein
MAIQKLRQNAQVSTILAGVDFPLPNQRNKNAAGMAGGIGEF